MFTPVLQDVQSQSAACGNSSCLLVKSINKRENILIWSSSQYELLMAHLNCFIWQWIQREAIDYTQSQCIDMMYSLMIPSYHTVLNTQLYLILSNFKGAFHSFYAFMQCWQKWRTMKSINYSESSNIITRWISQNQLLLKCCSAWTMM